MVGNVGDDVFGKDYYAGLERESIDTTGLRMLKGEKTGVSNIIVDQVSGENRILFTANANYKFGSEADGGWDMVPKEAEILVFQMEIPLEVVSTYILGSYFSEFGLTKSNSRFFITCTSVEKAESTSSLIRHPLYSYQTLLSKMSIPSL